MSKRLFTLARRNSNRHTQRGMGLLGMSMREDGYTEPMVAAANGEMLSGNARLETADEIFKDTDPLIVESDGTRPIVHVRKDISDSETPAARRIMARSNRIAELNLDYDIDVLLQDAAKGIDLDSLGFHDDEIKELLEKQKGPDFKEYDESIADDVGMITCPHCGQIFPK